MTADEAVTVARSAVGQSIVSALGYKNPYGAQCISLIAQLFEKAGYTKPIMPGYNAFDVYTKNPLGMEKVKPKDARPGDVHFMDYWYEGKNYGHTGIVIKVSGDIQSVDQNWFNPNLKVGSPAQIVNHPIKDIVGLLRPNYVEDTMDEHAAKELYRGLLHREPENDQVWRPWVGKRPAEAMIAFKNSGEWLAQNHTLLVAYPETVRRLAEVEAMLAEASQQSSKPSGTLGKDTVIEYIKQHLT